MYEFVLDEAWEAWIKEGEVYTTAEDWVTLMCDWHPWTQIDPHTGGIFGITSDYAQVVAEQPILGPITRLSLLCWWRALLITLLDIEPQLTRTGFTFNL